MIDYINLLNRLRDYDATAYVSTWEAADAIEELQKELHKQCEITARTMVTVADLRARIAELEKAVKRV